MLVGYEANNLLRNQQQLGDYGRALVEGIARKHIQDYRALLFATRIKADFRTYFTSFANVSTFVPTGANKLLPSMWIRYGLNSFLVDEKVKIFHGLNEELPYHIGRDIKTVITCYGTDLHNKNSVMDSMLWRSRMRYSFTASDAIVAVSEWVREQLLQAGVSEGKVVVIGAPDPMQVTDQVVEQYYALYSRLLGQ